MPGFTGTIWEALPPEELARRLITGAGWAPMAEAGAAYTALANGLSGAAMELRAIQALMGQAWGSQHTEASLAGVAGLAQWFDDTATETHKNADIAAQQSAGYERAVVAMPKLDEIGTASSAVQHMLAGGLLGPPLAGLVAAADQQLDGIRRQAAQTMRVYEVASTHLAHPWELQNPPSVSTSAALESEHAPRPTRAALQPMPQPEMPAHMPSPQHVVMDQSAYAGDVPVAAPTAVPVPVVPAPAPHVATVQPSVVAPVPSADEPAASSWRSAPERMPEPIAPQSVSAGLSDEPGPAVINGGFVAAPAVLGAMVAAGSQRQIAEPEAS
jgi:hypothetical protein